MSLLIDVDNSKRYKESIISAYDNDEAAELLAQQAELETNEALARVLNLIENVEEQDHIE